MEETDGIATTMKPMLTTSQRNFKTLKHCPSLVSGQLPDCTGTVRSAQRENIDLPGSRCFLLHGLLTPEECAFYVEETERVGYSALSDLYKSEYRSNDRLLSISEELADGLYERLESHLERRDIIRVRPVGFGNEGTWRPHRLNECFKFGRYQPGSHFSPHMDGPWVPRQDESSVYTVVIYLNDNYEGGRTNFMSPDKSKVLYTVTPVQGTALIFNHDIMHESEQVISGTKYIARTEIMFCRIDTDMLPDPLAYRKDENYFRARTLHVKSHENEQAGDIQGCTDTYLEALQLQLQAQQSIGSDTRSLALWPVPFEILLHIFSYLNAKDLTVCMQVCKDWYDVAIDGELWYNLYINRWPACKKVEQTFRHRYCEVSGSFTRDWYGCYKQRTMSVKSFRAVVLDLGSHTIKCGIMTSRGQEPIILKRESVVAKVPERFDLHMRGRYFQCYYSGAEAREVFPDDMVNVVTAGTLPKSGLELLPEILLAFFYDARIRPSHYPVLLLEPAGGWNDELKTQLFKCLSSLLKSPSISILSATVATLYSFGLNRGVVVNMGHETASVSIGWDGNAITSATQHLEIGSSPETIVQSIMKAIEIACQQLDTSQEVLSQKIVLVGGRLLANELLKSKLCTMLGSKGMNWCTVPYQSLEEEFEVICGVVGGCYFVASSQFRGYTKGNNSYAFQMSHFVEKPEYVYSFVSGLLERHPSDVKYFNLFWQNSIYAVDTSSDEEEEYADCDVRQLLLHDNK